jgi:hypothetical protein
MGPTQDIPGPEISAGSRVMSYWFDEYSKYKGFSPACVTGAAAHVLPGPQELPVTSTGMAPSAWPPRTADSAGQPPAHVWGAEQPGAGAHCCGSVQGGAAACAPAPAAVLDQACARAGKPISLHGTFGREYATGRGVYLAVRELLRAEHAGKIVGKEIVLLARPLPLLVPNRGCHDQCSCPHWSLWR